MARLVTNNESDGQWNWSVSQHLRAFIANFSFCFKGAVARVHLLITNSVEWCREQNDP